MGGTKIAGIYINSNEMTLVQLTNRSGKHQLTQHIQQTIPSELNLLSTSDQIESILYGEQNTSLQHLKQLFKVERDSAVFFSFPPETTVTRYFKMLKIPKKEWRFAVQFEARKYLPFDIERMNNDFIIFPLKKNSNEIEVVFFAVHEAINKNILFFLQQLGITPKLSETSWLSILRLLRWNQQLKESKAGILLSVELDRLGVALFINGIPYFSRETKFSVTTTDEHSTIFVENVAGEVRLAIEFHRKSFPDEAIKTLYSFGRGVSDDFNTMLSKECDLEVVKIDPFLKLTGEQPESMTSGTVIAIGSALKKSQNEPATMKVHLGGQQDKKSSGLTKIVLSIEGVVISLLLVAVYLFTSTSVKNVKDKYDKVLQERPVVEGMTNTEKQVGELEQYNAEYKRKISLLHAMIDERIYLANKLSAITQVIPDSIWLQRIEWKEIPPMTHKNWERTLKIIGFAQGQAQESDTAIVNRFAEALKNTDVFDGITQAEIKGVEKKQSGGYEGSQFEWIGSLNPTKDRNDGF